jgi:hypothetical protein
MVTFDAALIRAGLPDMPLTAGTMLGGRVLERQGKMGLLMLQGVPLSAQLPEDVEAGTRLRLSVADVMPDKITLRIVDQLPPQPVAPGVPLPLPDAHFSVTERDAAPGVISEPGVRFLSLRYESPALGVLDLRIAIEPAGVRVHARADAGVLDLARQGSEGLRTALRERLGAAAEVTIEMRGVDARA